MPRSMHEEWRPICRWCGLPLETAIEANTVDFIELEEVHIFWCDDCCCSDCHAVYPDGPLPRLWDAPTDAEFEGILRDWGLIPVDQHCGYGVEV